MRYRGHKGLPGLAVLIMLAGCATSGSSTGAAEEESDGDRHGDETVLGDVSRGKTESSVTVQYEATAKDNWIKGQDELREENYLAAQKYFAYVKNRFPDSAYAVEADLRIADCLFLRERYLEAIDAFQNFVRLRPTHGKVGYAMFMTGKAYYEQIPSDWFLLPPSWEKDQAAVRDAEAALRGYVDRFPNDENAAQGQELLTEVRRRLIAHERYVADFYRDTDKPKAYLGRLEVIRERFGDIAVDDGLLLEMAQAYAGIGEVDRARAIVDELASKFPASAKLGAARELIGRPRKTAVE